MKEYFFFHLWKRETEAQKEAMVLLLSPISMVIHRKSFPGLYKNFRVIGDGGEIQKYWRVVSWGTGIDPGVYWVSQSASTSSGVGWYWVMWQGSRWDAMTFSLPYFLPRDQVSSLRTSMNPDEGVQGRGVQEQVLRCLRRHSLLWPFFPCLPYTSLGPTLCLPPFGHTPSSGWERYPCGVASPLTPQLTQVTTPLSKVHSLGLSAI